ncbi:hypothetical protein [Nostoc sp. 'Lobaria pulmonaria (5183) cyanobiont']|nr:hypothetical protein [Nostoc sp. 'Lobaria pulmonaria (5183) cyanobiont']
MFPTIICTSRLLQSAVSTKVLIQGEAIASPAHRKTQTFPTLHIPFVN